MCTKAYCCTLKSASKIPRIPYRHTVYFYQINMELWIKYKQFFVISPSTIYHEHWLNLHSRGGFYMYACFNALFDNQNLCQRTTKSTISPVCDQQRLRSVCTSPSMVRVFYYGNTPIQIYTGNFTSKNWKFQIKNSIFPISAQNIDCGYSLEAVLTSTHNLCFWPEIRKIMYTPVSPSFTI